MTYKITLEMTVKKLRADSEAQDFAIALAEHINDTFNDDGTINPCMNYHVQRVKRGQA